MMVWLEASIQRIRDTSSLAVTIRMPIVNEFKLKEKQILFQNVKFVDGKKMIVMSIEKIEEEE